MNEKDKYLKIYSGHNADGDRTETILGKMGGGYGRICWGENMLEPLKTWKISSLLDVGCGYGNFCDAATLFVPRVYGLDIASVATGNIVDNPDITFFDGEAKSLPLPDNGVEWITSFDCLEHCLEQDIDGILNEFHRVAAKGFVLSISYAPCECDGMPLHMTVRPELWWIDKLRRYGQVTKEGRAPITEAPYLVCRKPVEKKIICYCAGGLGHRLQTLAAGVDLARRTGRRLTMLWQKDDPLCQAGFSDLFSNPIAEISEEGLLDLSSCRVYAYIKDVANQALISGSATLRQAVQKWGCTGLDSLSTNDDEDHVIVFYPRDMATIDTDAGRGFIRELDPVAELKDRIQSSILKLGIDKNFMGVHARGTDFGVDVDAYADQMLKVLNQNPKQKFMVCSEDWIYEEQLMHRFQDNVLLRQKSEWHRKIDTNKPWALGNIRTSKESVLEAVMDIYLLAHTDFRIYHESSAIADVGAILSTGQCPRLAGIEKKVGTMAAKQTLDVAPPTALSTVHRASTGSNPRPYRTSSAATGEPKIYYFCPDILEQSAGIRRLYRHVALLQAAGFPASILHEKNGFRRPDMPPVPVQYLDRIGPDRRAIFVIPEGMPRIMLKLKNHPGRRLVIALSWHYVFGTLPDGIDWRHFNIEKVLVVSPVIGKLISWSMGLPVHLLQSSIDHRRYCYDPKSKRPQIAYIQRKALNIEKLMRLLASKNQDYINKIKWVGIDGVTEDAYAAEIRQSSIFLSTSMAEGYPTACLEAMAAGAIVAGYNSVGGKEILCPEGPGQNCILAPNGDYLTLAYDLTSVLDDLVLGNMQNWKAVIANAQMTASRVTPENEKHALISFWHDEINRKQDNGQNHTEQAMKGQVLKSA